MLKRARRYRHILVPLTLAFFLMCALAPVAFAASGNRASALVGAKKYYLALGDSLAFGYQPDLDWSHGYADDFFANLQHHGTTSLANMGCPDETSDTFINGGCSASILRKYPYTGAQLAAAVAYLKAHPGRVSPVTLDIGANDLMPAINANNCTVNDKQFTADLAKLDTNLTDIILPQIEGALTIHGEVTGDLVLMNYYDPYQNTCANSVPYIRKLNQHLAADVKGFGSIVDVFSAFGGPQSPNSHICSYTWMCSIFDDIHARSKGYSVIAATFENAVGY